MASEVCSFLSCGVGIYCVGCSGLRVQSVKLEGPGVLSPADASKTPSLA